MLLPPSRNARTRQAPQYPEPGVRSDKAWDAILDPEDRGSPEKQHPERYQPNKGFGVGLKPGQLETRSIETPGQPPGKYDVTALPEGVKNVPWGDSETYGPMAQGSDSLGRFLRKVPNSERTQEHVYRVVSDEDYQNIQRTGVIKSDARMDLGDEGTVFSTRSTGEFYMPKESQVSGMPVGMAARIMKVKTQPGMSVDTDSYTKTHSEVPASAITDVTPPLKYVKTGKHVGSWYIGGVAPQQAKPQRKLLLRPDQTKVRE